MMNKPQVLETASAKGARHYGIDLLRILSMFSIVLLHVLGEGGVGQATEPFSRNYYAYLSLRFLNEFAVDAYGMITGYVMYKSRPKLSRLLLLWLEVLFYSAGISVLFILFQRSSVPVLRSEFYSMLLPITGGRYWYMSCYFCLFLLIPVLNAGIKKLTRAEMRNLLVSLFFFICVFGSLNTSRKDPFCMNYGFSTAWLCVLYLAGAFCSKYQIHTRIRPWQALLGIAVCVLSTVLFKSWMDHNRWRLSYTLDWMLMSNVSITYTLTGFFMLNLFARVRPGGSSPCSRRCRWASTSSMFIPSYGAGLSPPVLPGWPIHTGCSCCFRPPLLRCASLSSALASIGCARFSSVCCGLSRSAAVSSGF